MTSPAEQAPALFGPLSHAERLLEALAGVGEALDNAHAAGLAIPPVAALGMANLGLVVTVVKGQEDERTNSPLTVAGSMAEAERVRAALSPHNTAPILRRSTL